jgi:hypothetical protein
MIRQFVPQKSSVLLRLHLGYDINARFGKPIVQEPIVKKALTLFQPTDFTTNNGKFVCGEDSA